MDVCSQFPPSPASPSTARGACPQFPGGARHVCSQLSPSLAFPGRARSVCSQFLHLQPVTKDRHSTENALLTLRIPQTNNHILTPEESLTYSFCLSFDGRVRCSHSEKQGVVEDSEFQRQGREGSWQPCGHSQPNKKFSWLRINSCPCSTPGLATREVAWQEVFSDCGVI